MFSNELWQKSGVSTYSIDQSIRFNDDDTAYMTRTPASAGTEETWTYSLWVKRGDINTDSTLLEVHQDANNRFIMYLRDSAQSYNLDIVWRISGTSNVLRTTQSLRDPSAWYHFVLTADTNNSVASERLRLYINGSRVTDFSQNNVASSITSGMSLKVNEAILHTIGRYSAGSGFEMDGYLAEIVFIDGTALDPSSFGEYNDSNIWIPKDVSGLTFGTNGFHIDGRDSADLGDDESGNGNDFTTSGLAAHDQVADSPTNNFAVYNILYNVGDVDFPTYSEGNLSVDFNYFGKRSPVSTFALPTDSDAYCEFYIKTSSASNNSGVGIGQGDANNSGNVVLTNGVTYNFNGKKTTGGSATTFGNTYTAGDIIGVYFDQSDNEVDFYKNNTLEGSLSLSHLSGDLFFLVANNTTAQQVIIANFGQDDTFAGNKTSGSAGSSDSSGNGKFYYSRISGAKALCSKSLGS